jgi:hypothetical protein
MRPTGIGFACLLLVTSAALANSDRIVGEANSPPPFLTGFVPFDITVPESGGIESVSVPLGTATLPITNGPSQVSSAVALREPGGGAISDIVLVTGTLLFQGTGTESYTVELEFVSTGPGGPALDPPPGPLAFLDETAQLQDVSNLLFAPFTERTGIVPTIEILVQSEIPEPTGFAILGAGLMGLAWTRHREC